MCSLIQAAAAVDTAVCCHSLTCMTTSLLSSTLYSSPQMRFDWPFSNMASLACVVFVCGDEHDACAFGVCGGGGGAASGSEARVKAGARGGGCGARICKTVDGVDLGLGGATQQSRASRAGSEAEHRARQHLRQRLYIGLGACVKRGGREGV